MALEDERSGEPRRLTRRWVAAAMVGLTVTTWLVMSGGPPRMERLSPVRQESTGRESEHPDVLESTAERVVSASESDSDDPSVDLASGGQGTTVHVRVYDGTKSCVGGAKLEAVREANLPVPVFASASSVPREQVLATAVTDEHGRCVIPVPHDGSVRLRGFKTGYARAEVKRVRAGEHVDMTLHEAAVLTLVVQDEAGVPVPHAIVSIGAGSTGDRASWRALGETSADGLCAWHDLPGATSASLAVGHPQFLPDVRVVGLEPGVPVRVTVRLKRGRTVIGRVSDAETHLPLAGAIVGTGFGLGNEVRTDADGRFELHCTSFARADAAAAGAHLVAPGGTDWVVCRADGYVLQRLPIDATVAMNIELVRTVSLTGELRTSDGTKVADARVAVAGYTDERGLLSLVTSSLGMTDAEGRFALGGAARGHVHSLFVEGAGVERVVLDFRVPAAADSVFDLGTIVLRLGNRVLGELMSARGAAPDGLLVRLVGAGFDRDRLEPGLRLDRAVYGRHVETYSDADGRFKFVDVAAGKYRIEVFAPERGVLSATIVVDGESTETPELRFDLDQAQPGQTVRIALTERRPAVGAITLVHDDFVGLSIGRRHYVQPGDRFIVSREQVQVGLVVITHVEFDSSLGISLEPPTANIRVGDRATEQ